MIVRFLWGFWGSTLADILPRAKLVCPVYIELLGLRVGAPFRQQLSAWEDNHPSSTLSQQPVFL